MQILRMFSYDNYKGNEGYLKTQKKYEIMRTILYFAISISLYIAGWVMTKSRMNLLTIVAILGCLPASKSAVEMVMFLRFSGCSQEDAETVKKHSQGLECLYDMVFTSYNKNYQISHLVVKGNTICGYTPDTSFAEQEFYQHIDGILKADNYRDVSVKIFKDVRKYTERLEQLKELKAEDANTRPIIATLKSVAL